MSAKWLPTGQSVGPRRGLAVDETVILLTLSLSITVDTPTKGGGGVQQNDSLVRGWRGPPRNGWMVQRPTNLANPLGPSPLPQPIGRHDTSAQTLRRWTANAACTGPPDQAMDQAA